MQQTNAVTQPTPTSQTPTLTISGFDAQPEKVHPDAQAFILALLNSAGLTGNYKFHVVGRNSSGATFPVNGIKVKNPRDQSVEMIVQVDGKKSRYFGHLQVLESEMRPAVLHSHLRAVCEKKFFNPTKPLKKAPAAPEISDAANLKDVPNLFVPMPEFDEGNIGLALWALSKQPNIQNGVRIGEVSKILIAEMGLGNVNPVEFGPLVETWVKAGYLQKVSSDMVTLTAKGRALFETETPTPTTPPSAPPTPETKVTPPPTIHILPLAAQTPPKAPERNGVHHPSVPAQSAPVPGLQLDAIMDGFETLMSMTQELGNALNQTELLGKQIELAEEECLRLKREMEKAIREKRAHIMDLEAQQQRHLAILGSEPHKRARTLVVKLQGAKLH
ncbi:MAG: hypothetical protein Q7S86_00315 [bacterium]|nr:hypothetical protein [bacterium]